MTMKLYVVRDVISGHAPLHLTAENEACLKRNICSFLQAQQANPLNTDVEDKQVFYVGDYDDETMVISPVTPVMCFTVAQVQDELIAKMKARKALIGDLDGGKEE